MLCFKNCSADKSSRTFQKTLAYHWLHIEQKTISCFLLLIMRKTMFLWMHILPPDNNIIVRKTRFIGETYFTPTWARILTTIGYLTSYSVFHYGIQIIKIWTPSESKEQVWYYRDSLVNTVSINTVLDLTQFFFFEY